MKDHSTITLLVPALRLLNVTTNVLGIIKETMPFISIQNLLGYSIVTQLTTLATMDVCE